MCLAASVSRPVDDLAVAESAHPQFGGGFGQQYGNEGFGRQGGYGQQEYGRGGYGGEHHRHHHGGRY